MMKTAEFRRQLWLSTSPYRLVLLAIAMIIALAIAYDTPHLQDLKGMGQLLFGLAVWIWGGKLALDSMMDESAQRTWDWQRMSSFTPSTLVFGKLFGSTFYAWLIGDIALIAYSYAEIFSVPFPWHDKLPRPDESWKFPVNFLMLITVGLLIHASALIIALLNMRESRVERPKGAFMHLIGLWFVGLFLTGVANDGVKYFCPNGTGATPCEMVPNIVEWYGMEIFQPYFVLASAVFLLLWVVIGAYRMMAEELHYRQYPLVWIAFVISWMVYFNGYFIPASEMPELGEIVALPLHVGFALVVTYTILTLMGADIWQLYKVRITYRMAGLEEAFRIVPLWCLSLALAVLCMIAHALVELLTGDGINMLLFYLSLLVFCVRDLALMHWIASARGRRFYVLVIGISFILLYGMIPMLASSLAGSDKIMIFFYPTPSLFSLVSALLQASLPVILLMRSLQRMKPASSL
jgi:hypothetical protein